MRITYVLHTCYIRITLVLHTYDEQRRTWRVIDAQGILFKRPLGPDFVGLSPLLCPYRTIKTKVNSFLKLE